MEARKIIATVFIIVSLFALGIFISQTEFSIELTSWISFHYYMQFAPYVISVMLFYCGLYLFRNEPKSNFLLAIFGYTILELVTLDLMGIFSNNLAKIPMILFGCCAVIALFIAHTNSFRLEKLSLREIFVSVSFGALESTLLYNLYLLN